MFSIKKTSLFLIIFLITSFIATPKIVCGQEITGVSSKEFNDNYLHLLEDGETLIIDGRTQKMFFEGHLKNAINIDADDPRLLILLEQHLDEPLIVVYCTTVRRTTKIVNTLKGIYEGEIIYISDGLKGWLNNGFPVERISKLSIKQVIEEVLKNYHQLKPQK